MKKRLSSIAICLLSISPIFNPSIAEKNIEKVVTDDKQSYSVNCVTGAYKYLLDDSGFKKDKWYSKAELVNILNYAISNEYKDLEKERVNIIAQSTYETIINQVEEKCINSEKDYISRGNYKRSIGQNEDAIVEYDKAISYSPDNPLSYFEKGIAQDNLNRVDDAIDSYNKSIDKDPKYSNAFNNRGELLSRIGNNEDAFKDFNKAIELNEKYSIAYNNRGVLKQKNKDYEGAISDFQKAIDLDPDNAWFYNNIGESQMKIGDSIAAISSFDSAINLGIKEVGPFINRSNLKKDNRDYEGAKSDLQLAIKYNPDSFLPHFSIGLLYSELEDHSKAIIYFTKAVELNKDFPPTYNLLVSSYSKRSLQRIDSRDFSGAIEDINEALKIKPNVGTLYILRAISQNNITNYSDAINDYEKAFSINSKLYNEHSNKLGLAYYNRGLEFNKKGNFSRAIDDFDKTIKIKPDFSDAYNDRAISKLQIKDVDGACKDINQAFSMGNEKTKLLLKEFKKNKINLCRN